MRFIFKGISWLFLLVLFAIRLRVDSLPTGATPQRPRRATNPDDRLSFQCIGLDEEKQRQAVAQQQAVSQQKSAAAAQPNKPLLIRTATRETTNIQDRVANLEARLTQLEHDVKQVRRSDDL